MEYAKEIQKQTKDSEKTRRIELIIIIILFVLVFFTGYTYGIMQLCTYP